jgi:hypothetical protein
MTSSADASALLGTWRLHSYAREVLETGERYNQFGDDPDSYIGYSPDGRMYAIFTRKDRIPPADAVPTDEQGVALLGTMVAYAGTFTLEAEKVMHHIDVSWNQAWTGTDQVRFYKLDGDTPSITTAPYKSCFDGKVGRSILVWEKSSSSSNLRSWLVARERLEFCLCLKHVRSRIPFGQAVFELQAHEGTGRCSGSPSRCAAA